MNVRQKSRESPCYIGFVLSEFLVRDPRTKTGWSWTERFGPVPRTGPGPEKFWKSGTDSDRSVPGPGGPWIPVSSDVCILRVCSPSENLCDESSGEGGNGQWVSEWGSFLRRIQRSESKRMSESDFSSWEKKIKVTHFFENYENKRKNYIMKNYFI